MRRIGHAFRPSAPDFLCDQLPRAALRRRYLARFSTQVRAPRRVVQQLRHGFRQ
jgi:hypothetical protein